MTKKELVDEYNSLMWKYKRRTDQMTKVTCMVLEVLLMPECPEHIKEILRKPLSIKKPGNRRKKLK